MDKTFYTTQLDNVDLATLEEAVNEAKLYTQQYGNDYAVLQVVGYVKRPIPDLEFVKV